MPGLKSKDKVISNPAPEPILESMPIPAVLKRPVWRSKKFAWRALAGLVLLSIVGLIIWGLVRRTNRELTPAETIARVNRLLLLPADEEPTIATVKNPEVIRDQEFFKNAEVGDKVLIYYQAQKAILYSPAKDKIVEVAPLNINAAASASVKP